MAQLQHTNANFDERTLVVFGPEAHMNSGRVEAPSAPTIAAESITTSCELVNATTNLHIVVYGSTPLVANLRRLDFSLYRALRSLKIEVVYDTQDSGRIVLVWRGILAVLRSIPEATALERLSLTSPVPLASVRVGWSRSALAAGLRQPLYSIDHCLVRVVDRAPLNYVNVVAPQGEAFLATDWVRVRSFFPALYDYDMLRY